jgi:hypothetical protein
MRPAKLDVGGFTLRGKFPRIAQQILKADAYQVGIDAGLETFSNPKLSPALRLSFLQLLGNGSCDGA